MNKLKNNLVKSFFSLYNSFLNIRGRRRRYLVYASNIMAVNKLKTRDQIEKKYKWLLEDIYSSPDKWEVDFKAVKEGLVHFSTFSGKIPEDSRILPSVLEEYSRLMKRAEKYLYMPILKKMKTIRTRVHKHSWTGQGHYW
jgi:hypothetical protein